MKEKNNDMSFIVTNLVPEEKLVESLPSHWRNRFKKALDLIHENLSAPLNWDEVAHNCHTSSHHFLYMFRLVFNETPGQYQSRMRIKQAVHYLLTESGMSVAEVALKNGFSSSQALAKALKRQLGISASEIRNRRYSMDEDFSSGLELLLGHPQPEQKSSLETRLSDELIFTTIHYPKRFFSVAEIGVHELNAIEKAWEDMTPDTTEDLIMLSTWLDTELFYEGQKSLVGYFCESYQANKSLPEGKYLECKIRYGDISGYYSAWKAIQNYIRNQGLQLDKKTTVLEIMHNQRAEYRCVNMTINIFLTQ